VRDIARALDIRGPSLYAHVASKEDVLWAIVDRVASRFEAAADATTAEARDPDDLSPGSFAPTFAS
jgi:AcrR family transcriptional regulator